MSIAVAHKHTNLPVPVLAPAVTLLVVIAAGLCFCVEDFLPVKAEQAVPADYAQAVTPETLTELKHLRSEFALLQKDSMIAANAMERRTSMHALSANFFGSTVIVPIPPPTGDVQGAPASPNRGLLKAVVIDMRDRLKETTQQAKTVVVPDGVSDDASQKWTEILALIDKMVKHYNQIAQLSFQPQLNGSRLGQETIAMYEDTGRAQHLYKSVYASLKDAYSSKHTMLAGKKRSTY